MVSARGLVQAWQRESWWTYSGALSSKVDRERYQEVVSHALRKHFCQSNLVSTGTLLVSSFKLHFPLICSLSSPLFLLPFPFSPTSSPSLPLPPLLSLSSLPSSPLPFLPPQLPELLQPGSHQLTCSERETLCRQLQQQLTHHPGLHINLYDVWLWLHDRQSYTRHKLSNDLW